jgi:hypothetical protein
MNKYEAISNLSPEKVESTSATRSRLYSDTAVTSEDFSEIPIINTAIYIQQREIEETLLADEVKLEC